jgi:effector-binding domain-containing protein
MSTTPASEYQVMEESRAETPTITVRVKTTMSTISDDIGRIYHQIFSYLEKVGAQPAGPPFARYHEMTDQGIDMEAGVPLANPLPGNEEVSSSTLPGGTMTVVWYIGPYGESMGSAYGAIERWMHDNGYVPAGGPWENYVTDPEETAPEDYRTEIVWPVQKQG